MAFTATRSRTERGDLLGRIATYLTTSGERIDQYRVYRRTRNELANLSDRDLADLGISRSMITSIAHDAAYGTR